MIIITIIIIVFIIIIIIAIINIIIIFMVPFYEKRRVYVIQLSCGCCLTFNIGGGCFTKVVRLHIYIGGSIIPESPRLLLNYFFPLEPNQSPTNNVDKDTFPVLLQSSQSQKPMCQHVLSDQCFPDLTETLGSLEKIKQKKGQQNFNTHRISLIINSYITHTLQCYVTMALHPIQKCWHNPQTHIQYSLNTTWHRIGLFYMFCTHAENK